MPSNYHITVYACRNTRTTPGANIITRGMILSQLKTFYIYIYIYLWWKCKKEKAPGGKSLGKFFNQVVIRSPTILTITNGWLARSVTSFKYLGSVTTIVGSKPKLLSRIAQATAALTKLKTVWSDRSTSQSSKVWMLHSLVTSIFLYACESWTLTAELQRRIQAMEVRYVQLKDTTHLIQRPCYQWGSLCQDPAGNGSTWWPPDHSKEKQTAAVWPCLTFIRSGQNHLARHSERGKKTRQSEEKVGRQHQGMDRPGVRQVPAGCGVQGKMEETGREIICGAPMTLAVKG